MIVFGITSTFKNETLFPKSVSSMVMELQKSVMTYRVLLLLDLNDGAVLESPLDNVGLLAGTLDVLRRAEGLSLIHI